MILLSVNNASTTLASGIASGTTIIALATGAGAAFPLPSANEFFTLTLCDALTQSVYEVCWCTSRTGDSCTVLRGQEGTAARAWLIGDYAYNTLTAGGLATYFPTSGGTVAGNVTVDESLAVGGSLTADMSVAVGENLNVGGVTTLQAAAAAFSPVVLGQLVFNNSGSMSVPNNTGASFIIQWGSFTAPGGSAAASYAYPIAFPHACLAIVASYKAFSPPASGAIGAQPALTTSFQATNSAPSGSNGCYFIALGF